MYWATVESKQVVEAFNKIIYFWLWNSFIQGESLYTAQTSEVSNTVSAKNEWIVKTEIDFCLSK